MMNAPTLGLWRKCSTSVVGALAVGAIWASAGCGGAVEPNTGGPAGPDPKPTPACVSGSTNSDGCTTCRCEGGTWACSTLGCTGPDPSPFPLPLPEPVCRTGEFRRADDGCNSCSCSDGQWACTELGCVDPSPPPPLSPPVPQPDPAACPDAVKLPPGEVCTSVVVWARQSKSPLCCKYPTPCEAPQGWRVFASESACTK